LSKVHPRIFYSEKKKNLCYAGKIMNIVGESYRNNL